MAANAVLEHCSMDDLMPSAPTVDEAKETRNQLTELEDSEMNRMLLLTLWKKIGLLR